MGLFVTQFNCDSCIDFRSVIMFSLKLPILNERVRLLEEKRENILRQVVWARKSEEIYGDFVHLCELRTDHFTYTNARLSEQYYAAIDLAFRGRIAPDVATAINNHLLEAIAEEIHNLDVQAAYVALEEHYDLLESGYSRQASSINQLLVSLRAQRDDMIRKNAENKNKSSLGRKRKRKTD